MWHVRDAWTRVEAGAANVVLVHYDDLLAERERTMRALADRLACSVDEESWPELVRAAGFEAMQNDAARLIPASNGILKDASAFFRGGVSGAGRAVLNAGELAAYQERVTQLAPPDVLRWLHHEGQDI
jgi:hypothetical protein